MAKLQYYSQASVQVLHSIPMGSGSCLKVHSAFHLFMVGKYPEHPDCYKSYEEPAQLNYKSPREGFQYCGVVKKQLNFSGGILFQECLDHWQKELTV